MLHSEQALILAIIATTFRIYTFTATAQCESPLKMRWISRHGDVIWTLCKRKILLWFLTALPSCRNRLKLLH